MDVEKYRKMTGAVIVPYYNGRILWSERYAAAEATALVNFDCRFGEDGRVCKRNATIQICCCANCGPGLTMNQFENEENLAMVAGLFEEAKDELTAKGTPRKRPKRKSWEPPEPDTTSFGFWRAGTGCALPRKFRSTTCLCFRCSDTPLNNAEKALLEYVTQMESSVYAKRLIESIEYARKDQARRFDDFNRYLGKTQEVIGALAKLVENPVPPEHKTKLMDALDEVKRRFGNL